MTSEHFVINEHRLFAPVCLGLHTGYAHLDTGARFSAVLKRFAAGMARRKKQEPPAGGTGSENEQVLVPDVSFLGRDFHDLVLEVHPDEAVGVDSLPFSVMLTLGCDLLLRHLLVLDFVNQEISLRSAAAGGTHLGVNTRGGLPLFQVMLGRQPLNAIFDTGAGLCVLDRRWLGKLASYVAEGPKLEIEDITGERLAVPTYLCGELHAGEAFIPSCQTLALDLSSAETLLGVPVDFVFGLNAMHDRRWLLERSDG